MEIYLIRHGEIAGDPHKCYTPPVENCLSELGCQQADALANRLDGIEFTTIYASPLGRAIQTAQPFAAARAQDIQILPWLMEWRPTTVMGQCDDATYEEIERASSKIRPEAAWQTAAGESTFEFAGRIIPGFLQLMQAHGVEPAHGGYLMPEGDTQRIALVAHGGSLGRLAAFLMGIPLQPFPPISLSHTGVALFSFIKRIDVWYPTLHLS